MFNSHSNTDFGVKWIENWKTCGFLGKHFQTCVRVCVCAGCCCHRLLHIRSEVIVVDVVAFCAFWYFVYLFSLILLLLLLYFTLFDQQYVLLADCHQKSNLSMFDDCIEFMSISFPPRKCWTKYDLKWIRTHTQHLLSAETPKNTSYFDKSRPA